MRDQERGNPERRNPVRRAHVRRDSIDIGANNGGDEINGALHVKREHQHPCCAGASCDCGNRKDCQDSSEQIAERRGSGELHRHAWIRRSFREEHKTKVPKAVKKENGQQHHPWLQFLESGKNIDLRGNPEDECTEQQIRREDVHNSSPTA